MNNPVCIKENDFDPGYKYSVKCEKCGYEVIFDYSRRLGDRFPQIEYENPMNIYCPNCGNPIFIILTSG
jgi:predicted RNA-binding Zn-ribbon protein involved in translation (DUF1610 family)